MEHSPCPTRQNPPKSLSGILKLSICLLLIVGLLSFTPGSSLRPLSANQRIDPNDLAALESYQKQIKDTNEKMKQIQADEKNIAAKQKNILGEMKTISVQIDELQQEIVYLDEQIAVKEDEIIVMEYHIELKNEDVNLRTEYLNFRLVQLYMDGNVPLIDVLMDSTDITDFLTRFDMMNTVVDNDMNLLHDLEEARSELEYQKLTLTQTKTLLEEDKETSETKKQELQVQWDTNNELAGKLASDKAALQAAETELNALSEQTARFVADIQSKYPSMYMGDGTMGWPLPGHNRITSEYGTRPHPILKTKLFHSGLDIAAPKETPVKAAETGTVIMAGSFGGYGNTVILDHGGKVATQYSHMNSIKVKVGDVVLKGGVIGGVGTTGLSTGYHLHFEIKVNGATVNPLGHPNYYVTRP